LSRPYFFPVESGSTIFSDLSSVQGCHDCVCIIEPLSLVYMNKALTLEAPDLDYTSPSALSCARECLADNLCQGFALFRNIDPAAGTGVNCRRYNQLDSIAYDENSVTFFTLNNTLPIP